jgi:hypothetical protein
MLNIFSLLHFMLSDYCMFDNFHRVRHMNNYNLLVNFAIVTTDPLIIVQFNLQCNLSTFSQNWTEVVVLVYIYQFKVLGTAEFSR